MNLKAHWDRLCLVYAKHEIEDHFKIASMAQFILESGRGTSRLSYQGLNFAGLKYRKELSGIARELFIQAPSEKEPQVFCAFPTVEAFIKGYWLFIGRSVYDGWKECKTAEEFIRHLAERGYAADSGYVDKVKSLFTEARKLLNANGADLVDERPDEPIGKKPYVVPDIRPLPNDIQFDNQGAYRTPSGYAKGVVVHFTVSGRSPTSAHAVARYMASKGLGCPVVDEFGTIWVPKNWDYMRQWDDHAGKSTWKGLTSMSRYLMGLEFCCWGNGAKGKGLSDTATRTKKYHNQTPGTYQRFTQAQENTLINFVLWQLDVNPEFELDFVVGHDEISPGRKPDPGYSLSMSMPDFRDYIKKRLLNQPIEPIDDPLGSDILSAIVKNNPGISIAGVARGLQWLEHESVKNKDFMVFVDFDKRSSEDRLYLIDLKTGKAETFKVAHAKGSDRDNDGYADDYGNAPGSNKSSLGAMVTGKSYGKAEGGWSKFDYAVKLYGLQKGVNDKVYDRAIVFHSSAYVDEYSKDLAGRSLGCFAVDDDVAKYIQDKIVNGCLLYAYDKDFI